MSEVPLYLDTQAKLAEIVGGEVCGFRDQTETKCVCARKGGVRCRANVARLARRLSHWFLG